MAPGHDAGGAVLAGEVDEGDHRRQLELGPGPRHVAPDGFVPVQPLLVGARAPLEEMAEVELVAGTRRQEDAVTDGEEQGMAHHVDREAAREPGCAGNLLGERPVELLHDRVEQVFFGVGSIECRAHLLVHPIDDV